jgi:hypothetical protein
MTMGLSCREARREAFAVGTVALSVRHNHLLKAGRRIAAQ